MLDVRPPDLGRLRRIALAAQGLNRRAPFGRGLPGARKTIQHLGYIQIDTISVVERAHHHVLHTRVSSADSETIGRLLKRRDVFEYWAHAAAFLPMQDYRYALPYKAAVRAGDKHWFKNTDRKLMASLLARIERDGPLMSRELEDARGGGNGWWDWKPAKRALEQLYMQGDLMVTERRGFQKTYDLSERVVPAGTNTTLPTAAEFARHVIDRQLAALGVVSLKGITYLRRDKALRTAVKVAVDEDLADGRLLALKLPDRQIYFVRPQVWQRDAPRLDQHLRILSPFDNLVIQRERLKSLFQFDYQIECYVPAAKRQYGYFCLPLLFRDGFVGRIDCKAHRKARRLALIAVHLDPREGADDCVDALAAALWPFAAFQGCDDIAVDAVRPRSFKKALVAAVARHQPTRARA